MARAANRLMATEVKALLDKGQVGRHPDGNRLYLVVTGKGRGWWMLRYMAETLSKAGKPLSREMGLGAADPKGVDGYTLADARERADAARRLLRDGVDPLSHRKAEDAARKRAAEVLRTFRQAAEAFIAAKTPEWRNEKHAAQWTATLTTYAFPKLGDLEVPAIAMEQVKDVLAPIWTKKPETASRVRGRIEAVLDYATVHGWREGPNPARWKGNLELALARKSKVAKVEHHAALDWREVAAFLAALRGQTGTAARALEFTILTATRTGEVIGARWSEIDLSGCVWTIPAGRMALIFHLIEHGNANAQRIDAPPIMVLPETTAARAAAFLREIALPHLLRADSLMFVTEQAGHAAWIAGHILAHPNVRAAIVNGIREQAQGDAADAYATLRFVARKARSSRDRVLAAEKVLDLAGVAGEPAHTGPGIQVNVMLTDPVAAAQFAALIKACDEARAPHLQRDAPILVADET